MAIEAVVANRTPVPSGGAIDDLFVSTPMGASARAGTDPRDVA